MFRGTVFVAPVVGSVSVTEGCCVPLAGGAAGDDPGTGDGSVVVDAGAAGALAGAFSRTLLEAGPVPASRVAIIDRANEVIMKTIADTVVAFDNKVAEPRGPKAV